MAALFTLFLNNLLPILLVSCAGFLLAKSLKLNPRTLSQVTFYVFTPCLIFKSILNSQLSNGDILRMGLLALLGIATMGVLTWLVGKVLKFERRILVAVLITTMFMNAGNYGLPVIRFAFGEAALAYASVFFITNALLTYTVGIIVASMGSVSLARALVNVFKFPTIYGLILALFFLRMGWRLPLPLDRSVNLLGDAAVPSMMILLGMQFVQLHWTKKIVPLVLASVMRLIISPLVIFGFSLVLGLQGTARQAGVLEAAMPSAVLTTLLATEYDVEPAFVTAIVFTTTLLSPFTLTLLMAYLGG